MLKVRDGTERIEETEEVREPTVDLARSTVRETETTTTEEAAHTVVEIPNRETVATTEEATSREARATTTISTKTSLRRRREITVAVMISTKNLLLLSSTKLLPLRKSPRREAISGASLKVRRSSPRGCQVLREMSKLTVQ